MENQANQNNDNIYDQDGIIYPEIIQDIEKYIKNKNKSEIKKIVEEKHESEVADILQAIDPKTINEFVKLAGKEFNFAVLTLLDEAVRTEIIENVPQNQVVEGMKEIDSDDAVYILEDLPENECEEILQKIPEQEQDNIRQCLECPEKSAGRRMQTEFIAVSPKWNVGQVIDYIRQQQDLPQRFFDVFTVNRNFKILGVLSLDTLLRSQRDVKVEDIHEENNHAVPIDMDQEEAAGILQRYDLLTAPVVDENNKLVGTLTIDDIVDVIQEEADEDIKRLAGVGDEELSDDVITTTQSRLRWLALNLLTALLASWIIGLFHETIDKMVALAVLMPLVASMGGNGGTQTMTVAVRAIAERNLDIYNAKRIIAKELWIGVLNGATFAIIMGVIAIIWFGSEGLGIVIGLAMVINMICAAIAGILIPLAINKIGADPAIASGVLVTTVTDVVGFAAFLAMAAMWLVG